MKPLILAFSKFEEEFKKEWAQYVALHKELDGYRGIEIDETNIAPINRIISDIQDQFIELNSSLNFMISWAAPANQAISEYNKFMDDLKATGAQPENGQPLKDDEACA